MCGYYWLQANKLTLNTAKTHNMVFHRASIKCKTEKILSELIAAVKNTTFLGVITDDKLKWKEHLQYIKIQFQNLLELSIKYI